MTSMQAKVALPMSGAVDVSQPLDGAAAIAAAATFVSRQIMQTDGVPFTGLFAANELNSEVLDSLVALPPEPVAEVVVDGIEDTSVLDVLPSFMTGWPQNFERNLNVIQPTPGGHFQALAVDESVQIRVLPPSFEKVRVIDASRSDSVTAVLRSKGVLEAIPHAVKAVVRSETSVLLERKVSTLHMGGEAVTVSSVGMPVVASSTAVQQAVKAVVATSSGGEQPLLHALSQRIQLQHAQGLDVATVRLDPPQWGTLEVRIQQGPVGVQVVMQASNAEVGRQLSGLAEGLRQELQARTGNEASVVVAQSRQGASAGQGHSSREAPMLWTWTDEEDIGQALQV